MKNHVYKDGVWVRSPEVERKAVLDGYRRAGVPSVYAESDIDELQSNSLFGSRKLRLPIDRKRSLLLWVHASEVRAVRHQTVAYILRSYLDDGRSAKLYRLPDIVDKKFDRDEYRAVWGDVVGLDCLVLEVANDSSHRMSPEILREIVVQRGRNNGLTVVVSSDDLIEMVARYGETVSAYFAKVRKSRRYICDE